MHEISHWLSLRGSEGGAPDWSALPSGPGVVCFESGERTVLIATSADARALAQRKLGPGGKAAGPGEADLRPITARVGVVAVGSAFEADWVFLGLARERLPEVHRVVAERWRAWFVHVDPSAAFPRFAKTNLAAWDDQGRADGLVGARSASTAIGGSEEAERVGEGRGLLFGPLADKDSAGRFIEAIIDGFDLCRFHQILVQAPAGSACAYKEMGRCPAPCDGSESMDGYRGRVGESVAWLRVDRTNDGAGDSADRLAGVAERLVLLMREAADRGRFEAAAAIRDRLGRVEVLSAKRFEHVREISRCRWLIVQPSGNEGTVRAFVCLCGVLERLGDVAVDDVAGAAAELQSSVRERSAVFRFAGLDREMADHLGLVTRRLLRPSKLVGGSSRGTRSAKRPGGVLPVDPDGRVDGTALVAMLRAMKRSMLGRADGAESGGTDVEDRELGL